jgi:hypothetical protein
MPITFTVNKSENYFICKPVGIITGTESLESWKNFLQGEEWLPGLSEFTDLSEANMSEFTNDDVTRLASYIEGVYKKHNVTHAKNAIYSPNDLPFGLARMYSIYASESPELVQVFRDKEEAMQWLINEQKN